MEKAIIGRINQLSWPEKVLAVIRPTLFEMKTYREEITKLKKRITELEEELASHRRI